MELVNKKYYDGFEGEPEIQFIYKKGNDTEILTIWEGYFDQIMRLMLPDEQGWTGLAYCYNMLWSSIFVTLVAKKIVDYCRSSIESAGFHQGFSLRTAEAAMSLNESVVPDL